MELSNEVIASLYRIAGGLAKKVYGIAGIVDREDCVQIAMLAALEASKRFNGEKGELITFLVCRMRGAILDEIRIYTGRGKSRHNNVRFLTLEDNRNILPNHQLETMDELEKWKKEHAVSKKDWLLLNLRIGEGLTQKETGKVLGYACGGHSCSGVCHAESRLYKRLNFPVVRSRRHMREKTPACV